MFYTTVEAALTILGVGRVVQNNEKTEVGIKFFKGNYVKKGGGGRTALS